MPLRNVTLEMSLKPFRDTSEAAARAVARRLFSQWRALVQHADTVSVLLWCADGSEILDYSGDLAATFEWASYIGGANPRRRVPTDPDGVCLHSRPYLYTEEPPEFTYGWLKQLVSVLKEEGQSITGKPTRVGETFDPGPEFAKSPFKYERHNEICSGNTMGHRSFVCCYATLEGDTRRYAGFPDGIPQGTPFGVFFGRQCRHFLRDLGFAYVWFSNGFGFGLETWGLRGTVFDGERFYPERCAEVRRLNLEFWDQFRAECPGVPVETRGTNLSAGMDLASDAVPLREIYRGGYGLEPPPNSPWAALNGDFGLELVGWMSHIAEIPGETYPFRFYTHDPWWLNSPWLDRYGREPHDIYLPMAVSRLDANGGTRTPTSILFLTVDDSYGRMPDRVPNEVIPHILAAKRDQPDQPGPLVWAYPFDEYHDWLAADPARISEVFFGDWFMRGVVNRGLPLNTVVSTRNLVAMAESGATGKLSESILVSPVPDPDTRWERTLLDHSRAGGRALLYGPLGNAGPELLEALGVRKAEPLSGEFEIEIDNPPDTIACGGYANRLLHHERLSAGGVCAVPEPRAGDVGRPIAILRQRGEVRLGAAAAACGDGGDATLVWVRGSVSCDPARTSGHLLVPLPADKYFPAEAVMRHALSAFGLELFARKRLPTQPDPMLCVARHANGFFFSGYSPDTTVSRHIRFPQGAPLLIGYETSLVQGRATYTMPRAWHRECRVFVEQEAQTIVSCREQHSGMIGVSRRLLVTGLRDARVRFYHEPGTADAVRMLQNPQYPYLAGDFLEAKAERGRNGEYLEAGAVSGPLLISW